MELKLNFRNVNRVQWGGVICLCLMLSLSGCKIYRKFRPPDLKPVVVETVSVKFVEQSSEAARFEVVLVLNNPNKTPFPLVDSQLSLEVSGHGKGVTQYNLHCTVPVGDRQTVSVPVVIVTDKPVTTGTGYTVRGTVSYEPPGELRKLMTDSKVPLPVASFDAQGQL